MLDRIVTGGQTGADQGALRAARAVGIETGGWAPLGWLTEDGPAPWLADFGLAEVGEPGYSPRTRANVRDSDGTLWFGDSYSEGGRTTVAACRERGKPLLIVYQTRPGQARNWLRRNDVRVLNVAGNRESHSPGIGKQVERFMLALFRKLGYRP